jgi:hypothetical protein
MTEPTYTDFLNTKIGKLEYDAEEQRGVIYSFERLLIDTVNTIEGLNQSLARARAEESGYYINEYIAGLEEQLAWKEGSKDGYIHLIADAKAVLKGLLEDLVLALEDQDLDPAYRQRIKDEIENL